MSHVKWVIFTKWVIRGLQVLPHHRINWNLWTREFLQNFVFENTGRIHCYSVAILLVNLVSFFDFVAVSENNFEKNFFEFLKNICSRIWKSAEMTIRLSNYGSQTKFIIYQLETRIRKFVRGRTVNVWVFIELSLAISTLCRVQRFACPTNIRENFIKAMTLKQLEYANWTKSQINVFVFQGHWSNLEN